MLCGGDGRNTFADRKVTLLPSNIQQLCRISHLIGRKHGISGNCMFFYILSLYLVGCSYSGLLDLIGFDSFVTTEFKSNTISDSTHNENIYQSR